MFLNLSQKQESCGKWGSDREEANLEPQRLRAASPLGFPGPGANLASLGSSGDPCTPENLHSSLSGLVIWSGLTIIAEFRFWSFFFHRAVVQQYIVS